MGILENIRKSQKRAGVVPALEAMPRKYAVCENCGEEIRNPGRYDGHSYTGRWPAEGEWQAWGLDPDQPVYAHVDCPEDESAVETRER
jgi:ribosomal protein L32